MKDGDTLARLARRGWPAPRTRLPRGSPESGEPGSRSGRYEFHEETGRGEDEVAYRGRDADLGREVTLRVLGADAAPSPEVTRSFVERARAAGRLQHPGVVPVYELGVREDGRPFVAMKRMRGETLAAVLARPEERHRLLPALEQLCQALAYAHARGVVHGRLAPESVILGAFGEVQVAGFTGTGDMREDVRTLGRILGAALSGAPGEEALAALAAECGGAEPPAAAEVARRVAGHLGAARSRAHRASLRAIEDRAEAERARNRAALAAAEAAAARNARRQIRATAAAVLLAVVVAVAGTLWTRARQDERTRRTRAVLEEALSEATREMAEGPSSTAVRAAERAAALARDELAGEDLRRAADEALAEARRGRAEEEAAAARKAREDRLLSRLSEARVRRGIDEPEAVAAAFREAFAEYGFEPADAEAVRRDPLGPAIASALGEAARLPDPEWARIARAAAAGSPVGAVLDAAAVEGPKALLELAAAAPEAPAPALLAGFLADRGEAEAALTLLAAAWVRDVGNPYIHLELARILLARDPPDRKRAARHLSAAAAALPGDAVVARMLEEALRPE